MCDCGTGPCGCEDVALDVIHGQDGQDATVDVGATTTLPAGQPASVTNSGTQFDGIFNFAIPQGADGVDGQSAYELAVAGGFVGDEAAWIASLAGADGADGISPFTILTANFPGGVMSAVGAVITITGINVSWAALGSWLYITGAGHFIVATNPLSATQVIVRNPSSTDLLAYWGGILADWTGGLPMNTVPGSAVSLNGSQVIPAGPPGPRGGIGPAGPGGSSSYQIALNEGFVGTEAAWLASLVGAAGTRGTVTYAVTVDPNTVDPVGSQTGDFANSTHVANEWRQYYKTGGGWALHATIVGATGASQAGVFRVGKNVAQPIPMASTVAQIIQLEDWASAGRYNYGPWNGSEAIIPAGAQTPQTFILQNITVSTTGPAETITFSVAIFKNGASITSGNIVIVADTTGTLTILTTGPQATVATDQWQVKITPAAGTTSQWQVDPGAILFFNQT